MATFKAKKFREALKKAKNVGRAEDSVTIDGCSLVLQSLTPEMHAAIQAETDDAEEGIFDTGFQIATICRAIVEIEGQDLRNVDTVEDDVPDGEYLLNMTVATEAKALAIRDALKGERVDVQIVPPGGERTVLLERHEWLRRQLATWSREAISVAFRKSLDVVAMGEVKSSQDVKFTYVGETNEEKYRRLLIDLKEIEASLPEELVVNTLAEIGYLLKASTQELEEASSTLGEIAKQPQPEEPPRKASQDLVIASEPPVPIQLKPVEARDLEALMQERVPMNLPREDVPVQAPEQLKGMTEVRAARLAEIAGAEELYKNAHVFHQGSTVLSHPVTVPDPEELTAVLDQPPVGGINPRFRRSK